MPQQNYTLAWILPYVREALRKTSNFKFSIYANALFFKLEEAQVQGVVRFQPGTYSGGQTFQLNQMPSELRALVSEAFFHLFHKGYISPGPSDDALNTPGLYEFRVTERGRAWLEGEEPLPEEVEKYMKFLRAQVPSLDPVIDQYLIEALTAFDREAFFAAAVMLGAASEKELYLLADSVVIALKDARRQSKLNAVLERRKLLDLFESVRNTIDQAITSKLYSIRRNRRCDYTPDVSL